MFLFNFLLLITISFSQIQQGGSPSYIFDIEGLDYHVVDKSNKIDHDLHPMVFHYADEYRINIDIIKESKILIRDDIATYSLGVKSEGAKALGIIFDDFQLTINSELFIYSYDKSMHIGAFNSKNNNIDNSLETSVVKGEKVFIELRLPVNEIKDVRLKVGSVMHDFIDLMNLHGNRGSDRVDCNDNVACSSANDWEDQVDAVVLVSGGGGVCSGAVVNNTANDLEPYILYAAHCNGGGSSTVYFNYQSNTCSGNNSGNYDTMSGTQNLAIGNFNNNDYALIKLYNDIPSSYNAYYAGWSKSSSNPGNNVVGIHHADGDIKKISYNAYGMGSSGNWWDFAYSSGRVIPGSSGSPFFDSSKRIRGIASYIYTNYCSPAPDCYCSQNYYHGYAKFSSAWNYIDQYLDPINSGAVTLDGTRYGEQVIYGCTNESACNYDLDATDDDGSCVYSEENYDCNGNCTSQIDECGVCAGDGTSCLEPGDVNADGTLDIVDIILLINIVLGSEEYNSLGDLNNDFQINIVDVVILVNQILST